MSAFDLLKEYYTKDSANNSKGVYIHSGDNARSLDDRTEDRKVRAEDGDTDYEQEIGKDAGSEAEKTRQDHEEALNNIEDAIGRMDSERTVQKMYRLFKATATASGRPPGRPPEGNYPLKRDANNSRNPDSDEAEAAKLAMAQTNEQYKMPTGPENEERQDETWEVGDGPRAEGTEFNADFSRRYERNLAEIKRERKNKDTATSLQAMQKMSPALSSLLSAAAGWALSADIASKKVPPEMAMEWERAVSREDKKRLQEEMMRRLKRSVKKSGDSEDFFSELKMFYKDHAPTPPRYGLMWDAVKHRWTRPEKVGRTVWEVQGKKRLRGSGTGSHERTLARRGAGGKGTGSMEAGRRFRGASDAGRAHPHEVKHPGHVTEHKKRRTKHHKLHRKAR